LFKIKWRNPLTAKVAKVFAKFTKKAKKLTQSCTEETQSYTEKLTVKLLDFCPVPCALRPEPLSDQIYFVIEMIIEMIFKHMIRGNSLNLKAYLVFKIPFSVYR
jgi:hypothetical protein